MLLQETVIEIDDDRLPRTEGGCNLNTKQYIHLCWYILNAANFKVGRHYNYSFFYL